MFLAGHRFFNYHGQKRIDRIDLLLVDYGKMLWPMAIINEGIMTFYRVAAGSRFRRLYLEIPHRNV